MLYTGVVKNIHINKINRTIQSKIFSENILISLKIIPIFQLVISENK